MDFDPFERLPAWFLEKHHEALFTLGFHVSQGNNVRAATFKETKTTLMYLYKELLTVTKQNDKKDVKYAKPKSVQWINLPLSPEQNLAIDEWALPLVDAGTGVLTFAEEKYELVLKPSDNGSEYLAFLFDNRLGSSGYGHALSAKSTDFYDLLKVLLYKHHSILQGDWSAFAAHSPSRPKRS